MAKTAPKQTGPTARHAAAGNGEINGKAPGARRAARLSRSGFEQRWAWMDELARQLDAQWPAGVSAVDALADARRGG